FQVQLENGVVEVEAKTITITPKSSNVKTTPILPMETRLSAPSVTATASVKAKSPAKAEILGMTQMNYLDQFVVEYDAQSDTLFVQLADTAGLKANSTYKITMTLDIQDAGVNVKKQTITVPVKVLK
ncbi:MAG: hypothetical protein K2K10_11170, partial [Acetatifactor sp.]|nr:hypothetical protein [Acetatifactor sp.]